ncbi:NAD-dependent succinate-semialdehyde dehydrogenase [Corynebacterium uropygiale]|uniref:NAD-dependent succinate-semialdehyde dehydrogenase n=1 Tax=Corynebacterium uropygiale TaxID=1775911 RepID=A0A9X1U1L9_9CORY|nr:NAD-dependent succinate-semialdehyde dehydrogenase [Corynebacterium uropygiale]MCF4007743.1 NAD-dependent succinate-semialdehyde dehydrogenase [Corynebacterium uropygiale]
MTTSPSYTAINPATGEEISHHEHTTDEQVADALQRSWTAYQAWGARPIEERAKIVGAIADLFAQRAKELGALATQEMGKPIEEATGEAAFCADIFRYYAEHGPKLAADTVLEETDEYRAVIERRPIGPLLGIMPWNYPFYQIARFVAPNLMLGNTILLKHAESVPGCALAVQEIMDAAGVPQGVYQNIFATHEQVSSLIEAPRLRGVSLTGSERAGAAVAQQAGAQLKKAVLELGGSDPYIVLSTADARQHARDALAIRLENTGQACNSNKRIIVHEDVYEEFLDEAISQIRALHPADPAAGEENAFGPLSSEKAADILVDQVQRAREAGATVHVGGERLERPGFYVSPAVITDIPVGSDIYYEEFFGPIVQIYRVSSDEEALELANDTQYGLGSSVYAVEEGRAEALARSLDAGMVGVNQQPPETESMPFGGVKRSGYGRELGPLGMDEFVNKRLYAVKK